MSSIILRTATKLLVPLSLLFALFIYFKGHQTPGGGFVAGLVAAVAIIVHRMSHGRASVRRMIIFRERSLIGVGLALALAAGVVPLLLGRPFLRSWHGHLRMPGAPYPLEWSTVMVFDLGVFLVVTGVVVGMINALTEELE